MMSSVLRTGVGLNTRAGADGSSRDFACDEEGWCARTRRYLFQHVVDLAVNEFIRRHSIVSYVAAIAAISKYAEEPQVNALVQEIVRLSKSETDGERGIAAQLSLELSRSARMR